jgi:predicted SAM-dependent methyltransferase
MIDTWEDSGTMNPVLKNLILSRLTLGVRGSLRKLRKEWQLMHWHRAGVRASRRYAGITSLQLHLGCGPNVKAGWINIDLFTREADLSLDLREPWPFANNSATIVYSEHVFEHFEHPAETGHFLRESLRVLEPGGTLSLGMPDAELQLKAYGDPANEVWAATERAQWHPKSCRTQLDHINYHFRQDGEHKYAWDAETLLGVLAMAGFAQCRRRDFEPKLDLESRRVGTLYVEAHKPTA